MDRVAGIETEYGCLVSADAAQPNGDAWPVRVKNHLFRKLRGRARPALSRLRGTAGQRRISAQRRPRLPRHGAHRIRLAGMPATARCRRLRSRGDHLLQSAIDALGAGGRVSFIKNNVDHHTGATFGCHENYLMKREAQFTPPRSARCSRFWPRGRFSPAPGGSGRRIRSPSISKCRTTARVDFQLSQRADHIVNDIYQWVQFNRAIINARDEPLADYRKYRRLHLLIGDSNMSPFANALKIGTTACILTAARGRSFASGPHPGGCGASDSRHLARSDERWIVQLENGDTIGALDVQWRFQASRAEASRGHERRDGLAARKLELHARRPPEQTGSADRRRGLDQQEVAARSLHRGRGPALGRPVAAKPRPRISQHRSSRGLFFSLAPAKRIRGIQRSSPSGDARAAGRHARIGRARAVEFFQKSGRPT